MTVVPVCLFAYARPDHLRQTLACLRENEVPLLYVFSDGPRTPAQRSAVAQVRELLRSIDWCEVVLQEQPENLGLGKSILLGVSAVLRRHPATLVFEDDLICVPGTYRYLTAALRHYADDSRVMSVTGWTHPRVIPSHVTSEPYFDGRAECWVWGTWSRAWDGMEKPARMLMQECRRRGLDIYRYGADLVEMAEVEQQRNIWAVRFIYLHMLKGGLCLRPPWSLVEHIGFDALATNARSADGWAQTALRPCPPLPAAWPEPVEAPECPSLWQRAFGSRPGAARRGLRRLKQLLRPLIRPSL
ncbi:MAG: hypothetical protein RMK99_04605 [Anaerolineales bacterium]|nr:hypothetical protein [Anaerolineales bacterium]